MIRIVSWNIAKRHATVARACRDGCRYCLVQEGGQPPDDVTSAWTSAQRSRMTPTTGTLIGGRGGGWPALYDRWPMVVKLSDRVDVEWFKQVTPIT